ncbi:uncharacterized protein [Diabrotica undecimpunctata]|uniref:uncharacterized protein n=1 Tax=Diabrotica undecimpunctata TaxID=50387 RepID=UPI003B6406C2
MVVSDIDAIIEEESEANITPGPSNILNQTPQTPFHSRRRPKVIKCNKDILNELKIENERKKGELLDVEKNRLMAAEERANELHQHQVKKAALENEIRESILNKIKNNEEVPPALLSLLK